MHRLVLFSSVSGINIEECLKNLCKFGKKDKSNELVIHPPLCVEDQIINEEAIPFLDEVAAALQSGSDGEEIQTPPNYSLPDVLRLPQEELVKVCDRAFRNSLDKVLKCKGNGENLVFLSFHPVLYHHQTSAFAEPYFGPTMMKALLERELVVDRFISIHDDYDRIYTRLLQRGALFDPRYRKEIRDKSNEELPIKSVNRKLSRDLHELMLILGWRDRELCQAQKLAEDLQAKHYLLTRNSRYSTVWDIAVRRKPCVYISHAISQVRRDLLNTPKPGKSNRPDRECKRRSKSAVELVAV